MENCQRERGGGGAMRRVMIVPYARNPTNKICVLLPFSLYCSVCMHGSCVQYTRLCDHAWGAWLLAVWTLTAGAEWKNGERERRAVGPWLCNQPVGLVVGRVG